MNEEEAHKQFVNEPVAPYTLSNPHPLYGIDPNIKNEFGHTHYPKWIEVAGKQVIAKDAKHEEALIAAADKHELVLGPPMKSDYKEEKKLKPPVWTG